jgi:hypothetical protein
MDILHIVPRLPPSTDGVGDYAFRIAVELRATHNIKSHFIVGDPHWIGMKNIDFDVRTVRDRSSGALIDALQGYGGDATSALLNYVGYGYAKRGCPFWLVRGIEEWKHKGGTRRLVSIFHEVYAPPAAPWRSSFWTSALQKRLAKKLFVVSDERVTTMARYARTMQEFDSSAGKRIWTLPVFSNVGEPTSLSPLTDRQNQIVVFGNSRRRTEVYNKYYNELCYACEAFRVERIVDLGPRIPIKLNFPASFVELGPQSIQEISSVLISSRFGFLTYSDGCLAKSGVFAAYCAHKLLPIVADVSGEDAPSELDGLRAGSEYVATTSIAPHAIESDAQKIADSAYNWYRNHTVAKTATIFADLLNNYEPPRSA